MYIWQYEYTLRNGFNWDLDNLVELQGSAVFFAQFKQGLQQVYSQLCKFFPFFVVHVLKVGNSLKLNHLFIY